MFEIQQSESRGRICVAKSNIKAFTLVLEDEAAAFGPFANENLVCVVCLKDLTPEERCPQCQLLLHGECLKSDLHEFECAKFATIAPAFAAEESFGLILPLRLLRLEHTNVELWNEVLALESHEEQRVRVFSPGQLELLASMSWLSHGHPKNPVGLLTRLSSIVQTNSASFGHKRGMAMGHGLFPRFSLLSHECDSNCRFFAFESAPGRIKIEVRAKRAIALGEELTIQYKSPLLGNVARTSALGRNWFFDCQCVRCRDPSELGTFLSGMRCQKATTTTPCPGVVLPPSFHQINSPWHCSLCHESVSRQTVEAELDRIDLLIRTTSCLEPPPTWENLLKRALSVLQPTHYLVMDIRRVLIQLYGSLPGLTLACMSSEQVESKIQMCQQYLDTYAKVDCGYSKWRGRILEEMIGPTIKLARGGLEQGQLSAQEYKAQFLRAMQMLMEAAKCRQFESSDHFNSIYGMLLRDINDALASPQP